MTILNKELIFEVRDHVAYLTINRPHRSNSISRAVRKEMILALCEANERSDVWAVVITGAGDRAFCAGGDMKEMKEIAEKERKYSVPMTGPDRNLYETMLETYKPTIAALNGAAMGGGCELALACDLRIAVKHARLGLPEAKRGMGANFGSVLLQKMVPRAIAFEMLYTGEPMSADEGLRWGLINKIVPKENLMEETEKIVRNIVKNAPLTLRRYKHMGVKAWQLPVSAALRIDVGPNPYLSEDRKEGIIAFNEKRQPNWKNM